jgi:hypothetical protein
MEKAAGANNDNSGSKIKASSKRFGSQVDGWDGNGEETISEQEGYGIRGGS